MESIWTGLYQEFIRSIKTLLGCMGECNLQPWVRNCGSHISNMPNKMWFHSEHITYISMVLEMMVCTCQTGQINVIARWHIPCIPMFWKGQFTYVKQVQIKIYALRDITIYSWFRKCCSPHVNMPIKCYLHSKYIPCIPMVQKLAVCTSQPSK